MKYKAKIKILYFKYFAKEAVAWNYLRKEISNNKNYNFNSLVYWEEHSNIKFDALKFSELLQISFLKDNHCLSNYLLDNKNFIYPFIDFSQHSTISRIEFLDDMMTRGLLKEDHAAWLGLICCHHPFHLLQLQKDYNSQNYYSVARKFFFHPSFIQLYMNKKRREMIISNCPTDAKNMLFSFFLEMDLQTSKGKGKVVKI